MRSLLLSRAEAAASMRNRASKPTAQRSPRPNRRRPMRSLLPGRQRWLMRSLLLSRRKESPAEKEEPRQVANLTAGVLRQVARRR